MTDYDGSFDPPAPMVQITVRNIIKRRRKVTVNAILDTGSDITALPESVAGTLDLYPISRLRLEDVRAESRTVLSYAVQVTVADLTVPRLEVILTGLDYAVIGRDILNQLYVLLRGPDLTFSLSNSLLAISLADK